LADSTAPFLGYGDTDPVLTITREDGAVMTEAQISVEMTVDPLTGEVNLNFSPPYSQGILYHQSVFQFTLTFEDSRKPDAAVTPAVFSVTYELTACKRAEFDLKNFEATTPRLSDSSLIVQEPLIVSFNRVPDLTAGEWLNICGP
jgi:hypothetical protein